MPTTTGKATDLITFSRGSLATVTDSDGKIKWAAHNLLTNSEQFDASAWVKSSATVAANAVAAPNGTTTADTLTASGANGTALQTFTAEAIPYTFGVWLKRKTGTGTIEIAADSGTWVAKTITSDWALYTVTQTPAAGSKTAGIRIVTSADAVEVWGAHLYRSDLGGMAANASAYPMYNSSTPRNLLGFSEAFDNAAWTKTNATIGASSYTAPNGSLSAKALVEGSGSNYWRVMSGIVTIAAPIVYSVYVQAAARSWVLLNDEQNGKGCYFNLSGAGSKGTEDAGVTGAITSVGNGWYRCSIALTSTTNSRLAIYPASANGTITYSGTSANALYLWGAQLSDSASLDAYSPTFAAVTAAAAFHGPRLDFASDGSARGLLVEEARTNLLQQSADFNTTWAKGNATVTVNSLAAPDGTTTADKIVEDATATVEHGVQQASTTSGAAHTFSVYLKAGERTWGVLRGVNSALGNVRAWFNLSTGVVGTVNSGGTATITPAGNGWYRCALTLTAPATASYEWRVGVTTGDGTVTYTGDNASGIYAWGAQLEAGSFATSYIATAGSTVTRNADVASVGVSQFPYSSSASSLILAVSFFDDGGADVLTLTSSSSVNGLAFSTASSTNAIAAYVDASSVNLGTPTLNTVQKVGLAYDGSSNGAVRNGGTVSSVGTTVSAPATRLGIGSSFGGLYQFSGHIRQITYIPRRLSNAELQQRTV